MSGKDNLKNAGLTAAARLLAPEGSCRYGCSIEHAEQVVWGGNPIAESLWPTDPNMEGPFHRFPAHW
jgi:hypothetical protein